jgi:hypothetical protein
MHTVILAEERKHQTGEREPHETLRAVIVYDGIAAGKRAMQLLTGIANGSGAGEEFHPTPWSFNLLTDPEWSQISADDAAKADILAVAAEGPLPPAVSDWLEAVIERKRGTSAAIVALPGTGGTDKAQVNWNDIGSAAVRAGLTYFMAAPDGAMKNSENAFEGSEWAVCGE